MSGDWLDVSQLISSSRKKFDLCLCWIWLHWFLIYDSCQLAIARNITISWESPSFLNVSPTNKYTYIHPQSCIISKSSEICERIGSFSMYIVDFNLSILDPTFNFWLQWESLVLVWSLNLKLGMTYLTCTWYGVISHSWSLQVVLVLNIYQEQHNILWLWVDKQQSHMIAITSSQHRINSCCQQSWCNSIPLS